MMNQHCNKYLRKYTRQRKDQPHGGILDAIILKNIHDWNMTTGIEIEFCHHIHYKFETIFLGKETTISTGITYRLFGKK